MDTKAAQELLKILVENSARILRANYGVDRAEASLFAVIDLLRERQDMKGEFLMMLQNTLHKRDPCGLGKDDVPRELIELATHELRWPEFRALAEMRIQNVFGGDSMLTNGDVAQGIIKAYDNDWEDREFYGRYS